MSPFRISACEVLDTITAFHCLVIQTETGMGHRLTLLHKQADKCVLWHCIDLAFSFPITFGIPL